MVKIQNQEKDHVLMMRQDWVMIPRKELDVILRIVSNGQHGRHGATVMLKEKDNASSKVPQK